MGYDLLSILELCGIVGLAFWFVGFVMARVGVHKARREFRPKGYLRPPSGTAWFRFLLGRHYEVFEASGARFYFSIAHFCMVGMIIVLTAMVVLLGSEVAFQGISGLPNALPQVSLPK